MKRDYCFYYFTEVEILKQVAVVNTTFLFFCGEFVCGLFLDASSNFFLTI